MSMTRGTNPEREAVKEYLQQYHDAKVKKADTGGAPPHPICRTAGPGRGIHIQDHADRKKAGQGGRGRVPCVPDLRGRGPDRPAAGGYGQSGPARNGHDRHTPPKTPWSAPWWKCGTSTASPGEKIAQAVHMSRSRVFDYYNAALDTLLACKRTGKLVGEYMAGKEKNKRG